MEQKVRILIIDDEEVVCQSCSRILGEQGYIIDAAQRGLEAFSLIDKHRYDILIVDLKMPGISGMEVLQKVKETHPEIDVLMITGYSTIETAVQAMKLGAFDYICKPFNPDELSIIVSRIVEKRRLLSENTYLQKELGAKYKLNNIIGTSPKMQEMYRLMAKVAPTNSTVLIRGASGVGKELVARAVHYNSLRKDRQFVAVDCAGILETLLESELFGHVKGAFTGAVTSKKGLFEIAHGGVIFLDEIGNISLGVQAKLLRILQEHEFRPVGDTHILKTDIRLISATNRDLEAMIKENRFSEDLFYRLNVFTIYVPPLRDRKEDIPALAFHFLKKFNSELACKINRISARAMNILMAHDWPGNVRELENTIQRAMILAGGNTTIKPEHISRETKKQFLQSNTSVPATNQELKEYKKMIRTQSIEKVEKSFVLDALKRNEWNVTRAAADVGMQRPNFQALMKKYGIKIRNPEQTME